MYYCQSECFTLFKEVNILQGTVDKSMFKVFFGVQFISSYSSFISFLDMCCAYKKPKRDERGEGWQMTCKKMQDIVTNQFGFFNNLVQHNSQLVEKVKQMLPLLRYTYHTLKAPYISHGLP